MRGRIISTVVGLAAGLAAASACAMTAPASPSQGRCNVVGADKLPADVGGSEAVCTAIERAVAARAPGVSYSVELRVLSKSGLAAKLVANGRDLPEQRFSVSDRNLNPDSMQRFAQAIADQIAKAARL